MNLQAALDSYHSAGTVSEVESASRFRLVQIMMEQTLSHLATSMANNGASHRVARRESLGKAINLIDALREAISHEQGSADVSSQLESLYSYMIEQLLKANLVEDSTIVRHVSHLLHTVKSAWDELPRQVQAQTEDQDLLRAYFDEL